MFWYEIKRLPSSLKNTRKMFVVKAFDVFPHETSVMKYTSDPYCVWWMGGDKHSRWPHPFPPTHFAMLPTELE